MGRAVHDKAEVKKREKLVIMAQKNIESTGFGEVKTEC